MLSSVAPFKNLKKGFCTYMVCQICHYNETALIFKIQLLTSLIKFDKQTSGLYLFVFSLCIKLSVCLDFQRKITAEHHCWKQTITNFSIVYNVFGAYKYLEQKKNHFDTPSSSPPKKKKPKQPNLILN